MIINIYIKNIYISSIRVQIIDLNEEIVFYKKLDNTRKYL